MTVQFIEIGGQRMAVLPEDEFRRLQEEAEELDDIRAAEAAQRRAEEGEEYVPFELVKSIIDGENALRAWRKYRGLTQEQLAARAGVRMATVSEIENGKAQGKPALWRALAEALNVTVDDILPVD